MFGRDRIARNCGKTRSRHPGRLLHDQRCNLRLAIACAPPSETIERFRQKIRTSALNSHRQLSIGDGFRAECTTNQNEISSQTSVNFIAESFGKWRSLEAVDQAPVMMRRAQTLSPVHDGGFQPEADDQ